LSRHSPDLESRLQRPYRLREAIVVPCQGEDDRIIVDATDRAAAGSLPGPIRGRRWSASPQAHYVGGRLRQSRDRAAEWRHEHPSLTGAPNNVAGLFAEAGAGRATLLPVPAIVGPADTRQVLEQNPVIAGTLQLGTAGPGDLLRPRPARIRQF